MTLEDSVHPFERDTWTHGHYVEGPGGIEGLNYLHYYTVPWGADLKALKLLKGFPMPDRPDSGPGSSATIVSVAHGVKEGTSRELLSVSGFEAESWSD